MADATARGQSFVDALKSRHMYSKGRTLIVAPSGEVIPEILHAEDIDSPVMIDFDRTLQFNPEWKPTIGWTATFESPPYETQEMTTGDANRCGNAGCRTVFCCMNEYIVQDYNWDAQRSKDFLEKRAKERKAAALSEDDLLPEETKLLPNRVFGFILRSRKWGKSSGP
ncbi:hypothetical protein BU26DRAFT_212991 [Trematosphaeria pertusa]|uniref:Uncharacterized protein n=1 Tax=Trematosphaeria pertusa TaxID=390896 RepID=A0A6A6IRB0_9PLEO|nr:uncharacterized protein BU26DRAFT_212991 [Trematosphaeria pertusa]KAF2253001.1 hypothetical protein BU26DRAFT_212991 [Trematosphaeria pertusa]